MGVADVFRTEWPRLVATLVRDVGDLGIAEDAAQDAFIEASTRWPIDGMPDRPGAWLVTTGRRKAIDQIRRTKRFEDRLPTLAADLTTTDAHGAQVSRIDLDSDQVLDDQLTLDGRLLSPRSFAGGSGGTDPPDRRGALDATDRPCLPGVRGHDDAPPHPRQGEDPGCEHPVRSARHGRARRSRRCGLRSDLVDLHRRPCERDRHSAHSWRPVRRGDLARGTAQSTRSGRSRSRRAPLASPAHRCRAGPAASTITVDPSCSPIRTDRCGTNR